MKNLTLVFISPCIKKLTKQRLLLTKSFYLILSVSLLFNSQDLNAQWFNLSNVDGSNGFLINGEAGNSQSGYSVSNAGDFYGDGFDDIVIGAPYADPNGKIDAGITYIVFGKRNRSFSTFNLSGLNGHNGFRILGRNSRELSGYSVSGAGDVNGDGYDDIIIGAPDASPGGRNGAGISYIVYGFPAGPHDTFHLTRLNGGNGFMINGEIGEGADKSGASVSGAGDVNGDGYDDVIIGAPYADSDNKINNGISYVVYGFPTGRHNTFHLSRLNGGNGFRIRGENAHSHSGRSVSGAGDLDNDGYDDVIIGAPYNDPYLRAPNPWHEPTVNAGTSLCGIWFPGKPV